MLREKEGEFDLCGLICPLSKIKAVELIEDMNEGETIKIMLGDTDSLKSVAQELKSRGLKTTFERDGENLFTLTVTK